MFDSEVSDCGLGPQVSLFPGSVPNGSCVLLDTIQILQPPMHSSALIGYGGHVPASREGKVFTANSKLWV